MRCKSYYTPFNNWQSMILFMGVSQMFLTVTNLSMTAY